MGLACKKEEKTEEVKRTVFAGHGSIDQSKSFVVPVGTTLTVYAWDGASITDDLGQKIEQGEPLSKEVYKKIYKAGDSIPGYVLHPDHLGDLNFSESSTQVTEPTLISELLTENMGDCHWAACASIWGHENENVVHDSEGIFKLESNGTYQLKEDGSWKFIPRSGERDTEGDRNLKPSEFLMRGPQDVNQNSALPPVVSAEAKINGLVFNDVNQTARVELNENKHTLIAERVAKKSAKSGKTLPNANMATAHAEIGAMQQAFDAGVTNGSDMTLRVKGMAVCGFCRGDIAAMAQQSGLKSLTVFEECSGATLVWRPGMKSIKEG